MTLEFDLHLQEPRELFVFDPTQYDPFDDNALGEAGLDYLVARVIGFWFRAPRVRARVFLPAEKMASDMQDKMRRAMKSWCDDLLVANARERAEFFINNSIFLGIALLILGINLFGQSAIHGPDRIPDANLRSLLNYGLSVLVWIALWTPLSAFLLEWFPLYRRYQVYRALRDMELSVHTEATTQK